MGFLSRMVEFHAAPQHDFIIPDGILMNGIKRAGF